ncbi:hypothetical protein AWENTII_007851 [Aspergillus wentii]
MAGTPYPQGWSNIPTTYSPEPPLSHPSLYQANPHGNITPPSGAPVFPSPRDHFVEHYPTPSNPSTALTSTWYEPTQPSVPQWPLQTYASEPQESDEDSTQNSYTLSPSSQSSASSPLWATGHSPSYSQLLLARSVGRTPRLRYLISYYAEVIAPMIVAFDTPTNPFRTHILRLAEDSESLQEAIATLSTSNLRQRRERKTMSTERTLPARMSSLAHRALTEGAFEERHGLPISEAFVQGEWRHRIKAVNALNAELADPKRMLADSVLATLLILCLFYVCDTGVAQFKKHFAGVTRLLAMRLRGSKKVSDELKWFIRMFTWYDTMTATTNDREIQLRGPCLDVAALSDGEWPLENLAGCDSGLFKLIAQLGRLNLLSQNQTVAGPAPHDAFMPTVPVPPLMAYPQYSGNLSAMGTFSMNGLPISTPPRPHDQERQPMSQAFWTEWYPLRQKLESWRFVPPNDQPFSPFSMNSGVTPNQAYISPPSSPISQHIVAPENVEDVYHTSEAFRHCAILYSERLAYPDLSSSDPRIQNIVHVAIHHISVVQSDVYLLWPLFITGSECVLENHRTIIRERCKDISKDSGFFNNLSCLELLEKIWTQNPAEDGESSTGARSSPTGIAYGHGHMGYTSGYPGSWPSGEATSTQISAPSRQGFRWHHIMRAKRADGEYMVV